MKVAKGQKVVYDSDGSFRTKYDVDVNEKVDWKKGVVINVMGSQIVVQNMRNGELSWIFQNNIREESHV